MGYPRQQPEIKYNLYFFALCIHNSFSPFSQLQVQNPRTESKKQIERCVFHVTDRRSKENWRVARQTLLLFSQPPKQTKEQNMHASKQRPGASQFVLTPFPDPDPGAVHPQFIPKRKKKLTPLLRLQRSESSERIVTEMTTFKLGIFALAFGSASSAEEIIARSPTRRVVTITVPATPSSLSTPSSLHTHEIHLILLIWEIIKARHSKGTDKSFHPDCSDGVEEVVHHSSRTIARV
jgi:hypothetical protein